MSHAHTLPLAASYCSLPFAQIVLDATGSQAATVLFLLIPAVLFMNSSRGVCACAARVMLSVSRDNVLPRSQRLEMLWRGEPILGLLISTAVALLLGLVQLGSTAAFSSLLGSSVILFQITYGKCPKAFAPSSARLTIQGCRRF